MLCNRITISDKTVLLETKIYCKIKHFKEYTRYFTVFSKGITRGLHDKLFIIEKRYL